MYKNEGKKKIENLKLQERLSYGYKKVIILMLISGLLSILVIATLFGSLINYVDKINATDIAVKMCRVDVNAAARNVREMALNDDTSSYDTYQNTITKLLADADSQLKIIKETYPKPTATKQRSIQRLHSSGRCAVWIYMFLLQNILSY